jgi:hypothetical protein
VPRSEHARMRIERDFLETHGDVVQRDKDILKIRTENGKDFVIQDPDKVYQPLEIQARGRFVVLREQFSEGNTWHLLDRRSGHFHEIYGYPLFAPDMTRFVAASTDMIAGFSPNIFDIYSVGATDITKEFEGFTDPYADTATWGSRAVHWENNAKVRFNHIKFDGTEEATIGDVQISHAVFNTRHAIIELVDCEWRMQVDEKVVNTDRVP